MSALAYSGPQCPHCSETLTPDWVQTGRITCPFCSKPFDATVFDPPQRKVRVVEVAAAGPQGASACANHARNAAVTSCNRCGLFICSLCDMNTGNGSYCPACFDRLRTLGAPDAGATRYRDYVTMARLSVIIGLPLMLTFVFAWAGGAAALFFASRGFAQIRERGGSKTGLVIIVCVAILEVLAGLGIIGFFIWALVKA